MCIQFVYLVLALSLCAWFIQKLYIYAEVIHSQKLCCNCWLTVELTYWTILVLNSESGIGRRDPIDCDFPQCVNVLRLMIVQCGRESHVMHIKHWSK